MARYTALDLEKQAPIQHAFGNVGCISRYVDVPVTAKQNDTVDFIRLRKGMRIIDFWESHASGNSASSTGNFGLAAIPGEPSSAQADADYFLAAVDLKTAGRNRWSNAAVGPIVLDADYYVRLVIGGADFATAGTRIYVTVLYEFVGHL